MIKYLSSAIDSMLIFKYSKTKQFVVWWSWVSDPLFGFKPYKLGSQRRLLIGAGFIMIEFTLQKRFK